MMNKLYDASCELISFFNNRGIILINLDFNHFGNGKLFLLIYVVAIGPDNETEKQELF